MFTVRFGAILLMAGEGKRFGSTLPKQFALLGGKKVYKHTLDCFLAEQWIQEIILVCPVDWTQQVLEEVGEFPHVRVVAGGKTRQLSSWRGLLGFSKAPDYVLIHDGVRPFVSAKILQDNRDAVMNEGAVDTCIASTDTLVYSKTGAEIEAIVNRSHFLRGQTPQTFRYDWILEAHEKGAEAGITNSTDDCALVLRLGKKIAIVSGSEENMKITSPFDLEVGEKIKK